MTQYKADTPPPDDKVDWKAMLNEWGTLLLSFITEIGEPIAKPLFAINRASAGIRSNIIFVAGGILWVLSSWIISAPDFTNMRAAIAPSGSDPATLLLSLIQAVLLGGVALIQPLFIPAIFRRVILIGLAFWIAYRTAAIYLDDIFELDNTPVAANFIWQAAFYTSRHKYNRLVIRNNRVARNYQDSPISQIGGPGVVRLELENAALFEKVDGSPHIIGPVRKFTPVEGFERLRTIIDLQEQFSDPFDVIGRTRDGIKVTAKNVRMNYSIHRGKDPDDLFRDEPVSTPTTQKKDVMEQPLTFTEQAIKNLVYNKANKSWTFNARNEIQGQLKKFISQHSINEFMATASEKQNSSNGQQTTQAQTTEEFHSRGQLTESIYKIINDRAEEDKWINLHWIDVGTWVPPAVIPDKNRQALLKSMDNTMASNTIFLDKLKDESRWKELLRLIQDVPINAFGMLISQGNTSEQTKRELMLAYREKIKNALDTYAKNEETPPKRLVATLRYLERLSKNTS